MNDAMFELAEASNEARKAAQGLRNQLIQFGMDRATKIAKENGFGLFHRMYIRYRVIKGVDLPFPRKVAVAITGKFVSRVNRRNDR